MRPVDGATLGVPLVLTIESDDVTHRERGQPRRDVDVVGHEQRLAVGELKDEALVAAAAVVIGQHRRDDALGLDLDAAGPIRERARNDIVARARRSCGSLRGAAAPNGRSNDRDEDNAEYELLRHGHRIPRIAWMMSTPNVLRVTRKAAPRTFDPRIHHTAVLSG